MMMKRFALTALALLTSGLLGVVPVSADYDSWYEKIKISGDIRFRHENIQKDYSNERDRQRVRTRIKMVAPLDDYWKVTLRLATGSSDPVSTNQTLDGSFSSKGINLDQAFIEYKLLFENLWLYAGKMKNPFVSVGKNGLIWDGDLTPEGIAGKGRLDVGPVKLFGTGGGFWVEEQSKNFDLMLWGGQLGAKGKISGIKYKIGGSYYYYLDTKDQVTFADETDNFGNSSHTVGGKEYYDYQYKIVEAFIELSFKVMDFPLKLYGNVVKNFDDEVWERNSGHTAGLVFNKAKKDNTWEIGVMAKKLDKDAVVGAFCDSDFGGGGTDSMGFVGYLAYVPVKNVKLKITHINAQIQADLDVSRKGYRRTQADVSLKF